MQNLLRAAAQGLANLAEKVHQWADQADHWRAATDPSEVAHQFAGVDFVGIDFSTSIQRVASHVIRGWDRYCTQVEILRPDHGVWAFGVNAVPFLFNRGPVSPRNLPRFRMEHFQRRGSGPGLIERGSAFYDYFHVALAYAQELSGSGESRDGPRPITIALLCDGWPNGGTYRACDIRPLLEEARVRGVRFKLVGIALRKYRGAMRQFRDSLGLTSEEVEVAWYDEGIPDEQTVASGFDSLSHI
jgi:hypothetical protein